MSEDARIAAPRLPAVSTVRGGVVYPDVTRSRVQVWRVRGLQRWRWAASVPRPWPAGGATTVGVGRAWTRDGALRRAYQAVDRAGAR